MSRVCRLGLVYCRTFADILNNWLQGLPGIDQFGQAPMCEVISIKVSLSSILLLLHSTSEKNITEKIWWSPPFLMCIYIIYSDILIAFMTPCLIFVWFYGIYNSLTTFNSCFYTQLDLKRTNKTAEIAYFIEGLNTISYVKDAIFVIHLCQIWKNSLRYLNIFYWKWSG